MVVVVVVVVRSTGMVRVAPRKVVVVRIVTRGGHDEGEEEEMLWGTLEAAHSVGETSQ